MKIILSVCIFLTGLMATAEESFVADKMTCENGRVMSAHDASSVNADQAEYVLQPDPQDPDGMLLVKKTGNTDGQESEQKYSLTQHGMQDGMWSFLAFSVESAEFFYVLISSDLKIVSLYTADKDASLCGGGLIVTSLILDITGA